jgi:HlyD family secretion protein
MKMPKGLFGVVAVVAAVLAVGVCSWKWQEEEITAESLVLYGNVDIRQVELAFNGSQRIAMMYVEEGDPVRQGQLLAGLETARLEHGVARAEAQVQAQREVVARLEAGTRIEEIRKVRADVEAAEAHVSDAERVYRRLAPLARGDAVSQERADSAKEAAEAARAGLKAAQAALDLALAGPRKEDIAAARATLGAYEAELALARRELGDSQLHSPADGVIQNRLLEPGDMASPQRPVYTLALVTPAWVRVYVSETDLGKIHPGMAAEVTTDSHPEKVYQGRIGFISPTAEFTPKSVETQELRTSLVYQVRVLVCNPEDQLRLGMPATVRIPLKQASQNRDGGAAPCTNPS